MGRGGAGGWGQSGKPVHRFRAYWPQSLGPYHSGGRLVDMSSGHTRTMDAWSKCYGSHKPRRMKSVNFIQRKGFSDSFHALGIE